MGIQIAGLNFEQSDLQKITGAQLMTGRISTGHLFYFSDKFNRFFLLMRAGHLLTKAQCQKFISFQKDLFFLPVVQKETVDFYTKIWKKIQTSESESLRADLALELLQYYLMKSWAEGKKVDALGDIVASFEAFAEIPETSLQKLIETDVDLYFHALESSHLAIIIALSLGNFDFLRLQDLYHCCFFQDVSLWNGDLTYTLKQLILKTHADCSSIPEDASEVERKLFLDHPVESEKLFLQSGIKLSQSTGSYLISLHHDQKFEFKSDWEEISRLADLIAKKREKTYQGLEVSGYLKQRLEELCLRSDLKNHQLLRNLREQFTAINSDTEILRSVS